MKNSKLISSSDLLYEQEFPQKLVELTCPKAQNKN